MLVHAAYLEPYVRNLHFFQSLIYLSILLLLFHYPKWAYAIGISIGMFWLLLAGHGTRFVANGFQEWQYFLATGKILRPVTFLAAPAAVDQALLILLCGWTYLRFQHHEKRDLIIFLGGLIVSVGYFLIIVSIFNPQYLPAVKRIFTL